MADKLNELAGKFGKGGAPKGLGVGIKLLAVAAAGVYGLKESMYTGIKCPFRRPDLKARSLKSIHALYPSPNPSH